jgi:NAD(P)-dependent dehydrogenase (short-subunit alcohol dehydrogenase family)
MVDSSLADLTRLHGVNTVSAWLGCREAVRRMRAGRSGGRIVNIAAGQALDPRRGRGAVAYTMSKAAVAALTLALAEELRDEDILVNAVAPATLNTPANRVAMPQADFSRWSRPEEIADMILAPASPANRTLRGLVQPA